MSRELVDVEDVPEKVLYAFAADVADRQMINARRLGQGTSLPSTLSEAVGAARSGDLDRIAVAYRDISKVCRQIIPEADTLTAVSLKALRACVRPSADQAVLGACQYAALAAKILGGDKARKEEEDWQKRHIASLR
jgi:hypothetical protein